MPPSATFSVIFENELGPSPGTIMYDSAYPITYKESTYSFGYLPTPLSDFSGAKFLGWYTTNTFDENTRLNEGDDWFDHDLPDIVYAKWELSIVADYNTISKITNGIKVLTGSTNKKSIEDFIDDINDIKIGITDIKNAIISKGVEVSDTATVKDLAALILEIS